MLFYNVMSHNVFLMFCTFLFVCSVFLVITRKSMGLKPPHEVGKQILAEESGCGSLPLMVDHRDEM